MTQILNPRFGPGVSDCGGNGTRTRVKAETRTKNDMESGTKVTPETKTKHETEIGAKENPKTRTTQRKCHYRK